MIKIFREGDREFEKKASKLLNRFLDLIEVEDQVRKIGKEIKNKGDEALLKYTRLWDKNELCRECLEVPRNMIQDALTFVENEVIKSLKIAAERIRKYQERKLPEEWVVEENGARIGERVTPLEKVGIYVPGGKASYPSTVLMNAIPAVVAGVKEIYMVTPFPRGEYDPSVLVAADIAGVKKIFKVGGAQAIFALAYGTETIPKVDKIVGPGNIFVATAKKLVYGIVDIDMIAGPSEILIVADHGNPLWIAADLMSQAEHDESAYPVFITNNEKLAEEVRTEFENLLKENLRRNIIEKSSGNNGAILLFENRDKMYSFANDFAPEHLELIVEDPDEALERIKNAGAIFIGEYSSEPVGDYLAGPDHTLPTGGTARFFSPLGVEDFVKKSSMIIVSSQWIEKYGKHIINIANQEKLFSHAHAVEVRLKK